MHTTKVFFRRARRELPRLVCLALTVGLVWAGLYKRREALSDPIAYVGDSVFIYAIVKAVAEGEIGLFGSKEVTRLGAPFGANWNDYPWTEDFIYYVTGLLARVVGVAKAVNIAFLAAFVLAACAFYSVARYMRWRWQWSFACAVLYGCSYYLIRRSVDHFNIIFYWTCPLWLLVCWWSASRRGIRLFGGRFFVGLVIVLFTAWNNPYYSNVFLQLLTLATAARFFRGHEPHGTRGPLALGVICVALVLSMHLDTFVYQVEHGRNAIAVGRSLNELELYALRPVDLFLPFYHRVVALQTFTRNYASQTALYGEVGTTYLGIVGALSMLTMLVMALREFLRGRSGRVNGLALQALWALFYSVAGSFNMVLGLAGIYLFRAMNRVSVILLTLALFHSVRLLSRIGRSWPGGATAVVAGCVAVIGLWDQTLEYNPDFRAHDRARLKSDRNLGRRLDKLMPPGAMLFQLPTTRFPDSPGAVNMPGYDHLRPYIFSDHVRFSHGDNSGRAAERWREMVARMETPQMIAELERAGFAGILINTLGYRDGGTALLRELTENDRSVLLRSRLRDFVLVALRPAESPVRPQLPPLPVFAEGWYPEESDGDNVWHWSSGEATLELRRPRDLTGITSVRFVLTGGDRTVQIHQNERLLREIHFRGEKTREEVHLTVDWEGADDKVVFTFRTDAPAERPASADTRLLAFCLYNLSFVQLPPETSEHGNTADTQAKTSP